MPSPVHLRIFVSSPSDVLDERRIAIGLIDSLPKRPVFRGTLTTEVVAWDAPLASSPMDATRTPQDAVNEYTGLPSACDLTLVFLWSRLGTPLPSSKLRSDGTAYESGTVWELEDAQRAGKEVWLYRRLGEQSRQRSSTREVAAVETFFSSFRSADGSSSGGYHSYRALEAFAQMLEQHLEHFAAKRIHAAARRRDTAARRRSRVPVILPSPALVGELLGRDKERARLRELLSGTHRQVGVVAPAGFGKTALAAAAIRDVVGERGELLSLSPFPDGVVLLDLYALQGHPNNTLHTLANALLGPDGLVQRPALERAREAVKSRRILVVLEGAELANGREGRVALHALLEVLQPSLACTLILTREFSQVPTPYVAIQAALHEADARRLLLGRIQQGHATLSDALATRTLRLLEGHPLALTWAAGMLARPTEPQEDRISRWEQDPLHELRDASPGRERTLNKWFERTIEGLEADELLVLATVASLAYAPFEGSLAEAAVTADDPARRQRALAALRSLVSAGLLRLAEGDAPQWTFVHALSHRFAREAHAPTTDLRLRLAAALCKELRRVLQSRSERALRNALLSHAEVLLESDRQHELWDPLVGPLSHDVAQRLEEYGDVVGTVRAGLATYKWLDGVPEAQVVDALTWKRELGASLIRVAYALQTQGDFTGARESFGKSHAIMAALAEAHPSVSARQLDLCVSLNNIGDLQKDQGDLNAALASYQESESLLATMAGREPSNVHAQNWLGVTHSKVGHVQEAQGDLDGALRSYERSRIAFEKLAAGSCDDIAWQRALASSQEDIGDVLLAQGDVRGGRQRYEESLAITERLACSDPSNPQLQNDLSYSLNHMGVVQKLQEDFASARNSFERSKCIQDKLVAIEPTHAGWQRSLGLSLDYIGGLQTQLGDLSGARESYERCLVIRTRLAEADPTHALHQDDLAITLNGVALVLLRQGELDAAGPRYEQIGVIRAKLVQADPSNMKLLRGLGLNFANMGELQRQRGDLASALASYEAGRRVFAKLVAVDASNRTWQRDLSTVLSRIGDAQQAQGD